MKEPSVRLIAETVADYFEVTYRDLVSARRTGGIAGPRHLAMYLARRMTRLSLPEIGRHFGGRDHSTVLSAVRKIEAAIAADGATRETAEALETAILAVLAAGGRVAVMPPVDLDPAAIAAKVLDDPRGVTSISIDELVALAGAARGALVADGDHLPTGADEAAWATVGAARLLVAATAAAEKAGFDNAARDAARKEQAVAFRLLRESVAALDTLNPQTKERAHDRASA
jgi:hypothetical protein